MHRLSSELPTFRNGEFAERRKKLKSNRSLCSCAACHTRFFTPYSSDHYHYHYQDFRDLSRATCHGDSRSDWTASGGTAGKTQSGVPARTPCVGRRAQCLPLLFSPGHSCRRKESRPVIRSVDGGPIQLSAHSRSHKPSHARCPRWLDGSGGSTNYE